MAQKAFRDTYTEEKEGETRERLPPQAPAFPPLRWYHQVILKICSTYLGRAADAVRVTRRADSQASPLFFLSTPPLGSKPKQHQNPYKPRTMLFCCCCFVLKLNFPEGRHPHLVRCPSLSPPASRESNPLLPPTQVMEGTKKHALDKG